MAALAATLFVDQFTFLFWGMHVGMPPGIASVVTQAQAILTAILAGVVLHETPTPRRAAGLAVACAGLVLVGATVGTAGVTSAGLVLTLLAAASWAMGNVLLRGLRQVDVFALVVWLSVIPPLPLLALSVIFDGPGAIPRALESDVRTTLAAVLYIAVAATICGYGVWGYLLKLYPAGTVAPFALLVPPFGLAAARFELGEQFGPLRVAGVGLVVAGLVVGALPAGWTRLAGRVRLG